MARETAAQLIARLTARTPRPLDLSLRDGFRRLLAKLNNPQDHLPPVFHIAGTNGKGSTCAFLRAALEAGGKRVHVYTSPHLVTPMERIRVAGSLLTEDDFVALLQDCEQRDDQAEVTVFELLTAAAFKIFHDIPADAVVLEVGLGGRLDATNIVTRPAATGITRISMDHREHLGETLAAIAGEKAGIIKTGTACCLGAQSDHTRDAATVLDTISAQAKRVGAPLYRHGADWTVTPRGVQGWRYTDRLGTLDLPHPALCGAHQLNNAALALALLRLSAAVPLANAAYSRAMTEVTWPARLQQLKQGPLVDVLPSGISLWLDGGHNDSAGAVLADQAKAWQTADAQPLMMICGMLASKDAAAFLQPIAPYLAAWRGIAIPEEPKSQTAGALLTTARDIGIRDAAATLNLHQAVTELAQHSTRPARILIAGSLYLAGHILSDHS